MKKVDVPAGTVFGHLTFVSYAGNKGKNRAGLFRCVCGNETVIAVCDAKTGNTKSCGCLMPQLVSQKKRQHGHARDRTQTPEYNSWVNMIARCTVTTRPDYYRYGGRGISVCDGWKTFERFFADMGPRPAGTTLDRYPDRNGNYEPSNCRWATPKEQANNQRTNVDITLNSKTQNLKQWCTELGVNYGTAKSRMYRGETSAERILRKQ